MVNATRSLAVMVMGFVGAPDNRRPALRERIEQHPQKDEIIARIERLGISYRPSDPETRVLPDYNIILGHEMEEAISIALEAAVNCGIETSRTDMLQSLEAARRVKPGYLTSQH